MIKNSISFTWAGALIAISLIILSLNSDNGVTCFYLRQLPGKETTSPAYFSPGRNVFRLDRVRSGVPSSNFGPYRQLAVINSPAYQRAQSRSSVGEDEHVKTVILTRSPASPLCTPGPECVGYYDWWNAGGPAGNNEQILDNPEKIVQSVQSIQPVQVVSPALGHPPLGQHSHLPGGVPTQYETSSQVRPGLQPGPGPAHLPPRYPPGLQTDHAPAQVFEAARPQEEPHVGLEGQEGLEGQQGLEGQEEHVQFSTPFPPTTTIKLMESVESEYFSSSLAPPLEEEHHDEFTEEEKQEETTATAVELPETTTTTTELPVTTLTPITEPPEGRKADEPRPEILSPLSTTLLPLVILPTTTLEPPHLEQQVFVHSAGPQPLVTHVVKEKPAVVAISTPLPPLTTTLLPILPVLDVNPSGPDVPGPDSERREEVLGGVNKVIPHEHEKSPVTEERTVVLSDFGGSDHKTTTTTEEETDRHNRHEESTLNIPVVTEVVKPTVESVVVPAVRNEEVVLDKKNVNSESSSSSSLETKPTVVDLVIFAIVPVESLNDSVAVEKKLDTQPVSHFETQHHQPGLALTEEFSNVHHTRATGPEKCLEHELVETTRGEKRPEGEGLTLEHHQGKDIA